MTKLTINRIRKTTKSILATSVAVLKPCRGGPFGLQGEFEIGEGKKGGFGSRIAEAAS
jgi:hypothetical protein